MQLGPFTVKRRGHEFAARFSHLEHRETKSGAASKLTEDENVLNVLFARVYSSRESDVEEWVPCTDEIKRTLANSR